MEDIATNQITSQLKELGLTTHEALTYITLLTHPNITANTLCNQTKIPDSKIYYALDGLSKKGMITIQQSTPSKYRATAPAEAVSNLKQQLKDQLEEKLKQADIITNKLTPIYDSAEKPEELEIAYILRGQKSIVNRLKTLIQNSKKEIAKHLNLGVIEITPASAQIRGILANSAQVLFKAGLGIRQAIVDDPELSPEPKCTLIVEKKIPGELIPELLKIPGVAKVSVY